MPRLCIDFLCHCVILRYALIVGVLISLCSSLLGVTLVLRRFSFIGDGLSRVAFGAMAIATVTGLTNDMSLTLLVTVICAVLLLRTGQNTKIKGDAAIAMISVGALALGYLIMNIFGTSANLSGDVCTTLFGSTSILTLSREKVILCVMLSACTDKTDTADPTAQSETLTDNNAKDNSQTEQPQASDDTKTDIAATQQTESYIGKTVKMKGIFAVYEDETTGQQYFACTIADALGCCQQGLEFILKGEHKYPDDYPTVDSEITITGTFETYTEGKFTYCRIKDAVMN